MNRSPEEIAPTAAEENGAGTELPSADLADLLDASRPAPAIDMPTLVERCLGNAGFVLLMLGEFQSSISRQLGEIARHAENADRAAMHDAAHTLKGTASTLAAEGLRQAAADLEAAATANDSTLIATLVKRIHREARRCHEEISRQLSVAPRSE